MSDSILNLEGTRVLIVDDVPANISVLSAALENEPYNLLVATSGPRALEVSARERPDLILLDVVMPAMNGFETCRSLQASEETRDIPVIFVTSRGDVSGIVEGFRAGAVDYVTKPFHQGEVVARVRTHLERTLLIRELRAKNLALEEAIAKRDALDQRLTLLSRREADHWGVLGFIGRSAIIREILRRIGLLQDADTVSVLITGESGTGKELIARAIHAGSPRAKGPFIPLNCATIPAQLAESQLFGHVKGAFTGADAPQTGLFESADGGTLFLDEIGSMPPDLQPKLLRVLEDGRVRRLGTTTDLEVDVRIIAATNTPPHAMREDLYFRLARFTVEMPPLRERKEDIPLLAEHFVRLFAAEMGREGAVLTDEALEWLEAYEYPGNVRELKNIVERALIECGGEPIGRRHLYGRRAPGAAPSASSGLGSEAGMDLPLDLGEAQRRLVERALERTHGNVTQAARLLGIDRNKLYRIRASQRSMS